MNKKNILLSPKLFFVCVILFGATFSVSIGAALSEDSIGKSFAVSPPNLERKIWYVGGSGADNFTIIQDAIDAASTGDIIRVYPGTYYEKQISINKGISVLGAGPSSTIIDGSGATLSTEGLVRITADDDVTFSGFTVRNAGGPTGYGGGDNKLNMGITVCSGTTAVTYTITSNAIYGTNDPDDDYDWGFYAINGGKENIIFSHNTITQTGCNNIVIERTTGSTDISYNALDAGCWGIDSIYYMTYDGTDVTSLQKISNNTIDIGTGINPGGPSYNKVTAIGFSSAYLGCTGVTDTGRYSNIVITQNTIKNLKEWRRGIALDSFAWGDGTGGDISNAIIKKNTITAVSSNPQSFAIRLSGRVQNTVIRENQITGCDMSFWGRVGYYGGSTAYPTNTQIGANSFLDNEGGLVWEGATLLDARLNWWGSLEIEDSIDGNVDYAPWYGVAPGTTPMTICTDDSIGEAINMTSVGDTVFVCEGTYHEHLTLSKKLNLLGEDCNTTILDGSSVGKVLSITSDDVYVKGFTFQHSGIYEQDAGVYIRSNGNTITGNIFTKNAEGIHIWDSTSNKITKNKVTDCTYGIFFETSDANIIEDNRITKNTQGIFLESSSDNDINGNFISDNKYGIWLRSYCNLNNIQYNQIESNTGRGIYLEHLTDKNTIIFHNNFVDNTVHAYFVSTVVSRWNSNYWDDWIGIRFPQFEMFPKVILGRFFSIIPWINIDRNPAAGPYSL